MSVYSKSPFVCQVPLLTEVLQSLHAVPSILDGLYAVDRGIVIALHHVYSMMLSGGRPVQESLLQAACYQH